MTLSIQADELAARQREEPAAAADGSDGQEPMTAVLVPPHRVSVMWTTWVFFKTFFSSLIPEVRQGVANWPPRADDWCWRCLKAGGRKRKTSGAVNSRINKTKALVGVHVNNDWDLPIETESWTSSDNCSSFWVKNTKLKHQQKKAVPDPWIYPNVAWKQRTRRTRYISHIFNHKKLFLEYRSWPNSFCWFLPLPKVFFCVTRPSPWNNSRWQLRVKNKPVSWRCWTTVPKWFFLWGDLCTWAFWSHRIPNQLVLNFHIEEYDPDGYSHN